MYSRGFCALYAASCLLISPALAAPAEEQRPRDERNNTVRPMQGPTITPNERRRPSDLQVQPGVQLETAREEEKVSRVSYERFEASGERLTETATVVHRGPDRFTALQGFNFRFTNGWHKIRRIGALNEGEHIRASFNDDGGEDPFNFNARYLHIDWDGFENVDHRSDEALRNRIYDFEVQEENCAERCTIRIPRASPYHTMVLTGFEFARRDFVDDYNVRSIGVTLLPDRGVAEVHMYDDRSSDFSDVSRWGAAILPKPIVVADSDGEEGRYPITVRLQGLYVPLDLVNHAGRIIGASREDAAYPNRAIPDHPDAEFSQYHPYALMGFGVAFGNSDHFLQEFGVDMENAPVVRFQDGDTDDPISWFIDYVSFKREVFED